MTRKVIIHSTSRLLDDYFKVDEVKFSYERFDGSMSEPVRRLVYERGESVAAVVFNVDSRHVVLTEQLRIPTYAAGPGWMIELVAGIVSEHETAEEALRREVREEIGYEIDRLVPLGSVYLSPGGSSERVSIFYAQVNDRSKVDRGGGLPSEGEDIRVVEFDLDELREGTVLARIQDAKTLIGINWMLSRIDRDGR